MGGYWIIPTRVPRTIQKPNKKSLKLKSVSSSASDNDDSALAAGGENPLPRIDDDFVMDDDDDFAIEDDVRE